MIYFIKSGNVSGHGLGASAPDIVAVVVVLNADDTVELQLNTPVSIFSLGTKQNIKIIVIVVALVVLNYTLQKSNIEEKNYSICFVRFFCNFKMSPIKIYRP